ncbi:MAG: dibenzothiophene desulfurase [Rhodobacteraceae bacterium]|nr:MAG: dibenzothiophene desulfurase [Paracoccaceae bacterium]
MKPATSLILFTVLSGFGFGLLFWLNLGVSSNGKLSELVSFSLAFLISISGLISSSFHLGNPQRALLAFTQWRSSWLSREAILAMWTLLLTFIHAGLIIGFNRYIYWLGYIASGFCLFTIFSTAMIYTQMKTVPRWNMKITPVLFLLYGTVGSSLVLDQFLFSFFLFLILGFIQIITWKLGDQQFEKRSSIKTATGLTKTNSLVRMLEPPHTGSNYLLKEMVNIVAQKHIHKLRIISICLLSLLPAILCLTNLASDKSYFVMSLAAVVTNILGTLISRWLFFSEAEHVVGLYYDR